ncbi:MAG: exodeoxyribonuclease VII large subunit, partial [Ruminococcus sp.]|nr:exodeoxyribonuclease VII large subunit [Ruminococcus sp.]
LSYYNSQQQYISSILDNKISKAKTLLLERRTSILNNSPEKKLLEIEKNLENLSRIAEFCTNNSFIEKSKTINSLGAKLEALNPISVLQRGYSIAEKDGKIINSAKELKADDIIKLTLKDGNINTKVLEN